MKAAKRRRAFAYRAIDHTADLGFDVCGRTRKELFRHAASALLDAVVAPSAIEAREERAIDIAGSDLADLWINYLREILYLLNGCGFLVRTVNILNLTGKRLSFVARGERYDPMRHTLLTEIKAVTYHRAEIERTATGWRGRFIVDV